MKNHDRPEIENYLDHLLTERGLSDNTIAAYRRDLYRFECFLRAGNRTPAEIDYPFFTSFVIELRETLAPVSVARLLSAVSGYLAFLVREGRLAAHPLPDLEAPRREKNLPGVLDRAEVARLLGTPGDSPIGIRDRAVLELLYATGMRVSELTALNLADLDLRENLARVRGKGGRERLVPFGEPARAALERYLARRRGPAGLPGTPTAVFPGRRNRGLSRQAVWKIIRRAALAAGINRPVYPHILRHSFATHFLEGGAGIRSVQELLGHQSLATTQVYTHLEQKRLKEIHRRFHPRP